MQAEKQMDRQNQPRHNQRAAANRRPAGQSAGPAEFQRARRSRSASPARVAELCR